MSSESKAFNEVRALLGKMDRSIDRARERRLGPEEPPVDRARPPVSQDQTVGGPKPELGNPPPASPRRNTQFGRARPLNREGQETTQWRSSHEGDSSWDQDTTIG